MSDEQRTASESEVTAEVIAAAASEGRASPNGWGADSAVDPLAENPEVMIGAAFVGGFVLARIVRRLGR